MTVSDNLPTITLQKRLPEGFDDRIGTYHETFQKKYEFIKESNQKKIEIRVYQDVLAECFYTQKQSYMKNCRTLALEYLEMIKYPAEHKM
eukprot:gene4272-4987_t